MVPFHHHHQQAHRKRSYRNHTTKLLKAFCLDDNHLTGKPQPAWISNDWFTISMVDKVVVERNGWTITSGMLLKNNWPQCSRAQTLDCECHSQLSEINSFKSFMMWVSNRLQSLQWVVSTQMSSICQPVLHTITHPKVSNSWLTTKEQKISVHFIDVQMQAGGSDCGFFASYSI